MNNCWECDVRPATEGLWCEQCDADVARQLRYDHLWWKQAYNVIHNTLCDWWLRLRGL